MNLRSAWLTINRNCNLGCDWCYAKNLDSEINNEMSFSLAKELIDISLSVGIKDFKIIGGEPTLHSEIFELLQYLIDNNCKIVIVTNGLMLSNKLFCEQIYKLKYDKLFFGISLKGASNEEYLKNCGMPAFDLVLKGLKNCDELCFKYSLSYVLTVENIEKLDTFSRQIKKVGINKPITFSFCNDVICSNDLSSHQDPLKINEVFERKYNTIDAILGKRLFLHQSLPLCMCSRRLQKEMISSNQLTTSCHVHRRSGVIFDIDGSILLCNHLVGFSVGEYKKDYDDGESFNNFWNSKYMTELHRKFTTVPSSECLCCDIRTDCGGGCCIQWFFNDFESYKKRREKNELR